MPAVKHLFGLWSSLAGSFEIARPSISTDDLHSWVGGQPASQHLLVTAQQHLDRLVALQVHQQCPCGVGLKGPIIHSQHPRCGFVYRSPLAHQREHSCCTDRPVLGRTLAGPCLSTQCPSHAKEGFTKSRGATSVGFGAICERFGKDPPCTGGILTEKAMDLDVQPYPPFAP